MAQLYSFRVDRVGDVWLDFNIYSICTSYENNILKLPKADTVHMQDIRVKKLDYNAYGSLGIMRFEIRNRLIL